MDAISRNANRLLRVISLQGVDYLMMAAMFSRLSLRAVREKEVEGRGGVVLAATCPEYKGEGDRGISQG
jgi:hypothetical protein